MNSYHIQFYFSEKVNFETNVDSNLNLKEFVEDFNSKIQQSSTKYINFLGEPTITINMNKVLFYTIIDKKIKEIIESE